MPIYESFSYRKRVAEGRVADVFVYDELPGTLRAQIVHIWWDAIGEGFRNPLAWEQIHDIVARELGVFALSRGKSPAERCQNFILGESTLEYALDLVEVSFRYIDRAVSRYGSVRRREAGIKTEALDAIAELNERFRRAGVGYQYEEGLIVRIDSDLIHSEITKPALRFLNEPEFAGPREEFLKAHAHYRAGETKDAIVDANNAFESTLRAVCDQRGWPYDPGTPVSVLLKILHNNGLLPNYLDNSFKQLAATLHSGLPQVRNSEGGHGQGATPRETPDHVAGYALHLAAANILFIVEAHKAMG